MDNNLLTTLSEDMFVSVASGNMKAPIPGLYGTQILMNLDVHYMVFIKCIIKVSPEQQIDLIACQLRCEQRACSSVRNLSGML